MIRALLIAILLSSAAHAGESPAPSPQQPPPSPDLSAAVAVPTGPEKEVADKLDLLFAAGPDKDEAKWHKDVEDALIKYFPIAPESKGFNDHLLKYFQMLVDKQDAAALAAFGKTIAAAAPNIKMRMGMTMMVTQVLDMVDASAKAVDVIRATMADPGAKEFLPNLKMLLANQLGSAGQYDEAAKLFEGLIKEQPSPGLKLKLADMQLQGGKPKESLATMDEILTSKEEKEAPGQVHVLAARAHAALAEGAEGEAAKKERKTALDLYGEVTAAAAKDAQKVGFIGVVAFTDASNVHLAAGDVEKATQALKDMQKVYTGPQETQIAEQKLASLAWIGKSVEPFTGPGLDGSDVKAAELAGKIWLLDFWATWCPPCRAEIPNLVKLAKATAGKPFAILSVSLDKPNEKEKVAKFTREHEMDWTHVYDGKGWAGPICQAFVIHAIPSAFLVDENMKIVAAGLAGKELETAVLAQLARLEKGKGTKKQKKKRNK